MGTGRRRREEKRKAATKQGEWSFEDRDEEREGMSR